MVARSAKAAAAKVVSKAGKKAQATAQKAETKEPKKPRARKEKEVVEQVIEAVIVPVPETIAPVESIAPAKKKSSMERFIERTGLSEADYYAWARECGNKASHSHKDSSLAKKLGIEIEKLADYKRLVYVPENMGTLELAEYYLQYAENPGDLALAYFSLKDFTGEDHTKEGFIAFNIRATTKESFKRFGDANNFSSVSPSYFSKEGTPLDIQSEVMTETAGYEITIQDLVDFMMSYKWGKYKSRWVILQESIQAKIEEICGFQVKEKYLSRLTDLVGFQLSAETDIVNQEVELENVPF